MIQWMSVSVCTAVLTDLSLKDWKWREGKFPRECLLSAIKYTTDSPEPVLTSLQTDQLH